MAEYEQSDLHLGKPRCLNVLTGHSFKSTSVMRLSLYYFDLLNCQPPRGYTANHENKWSQRNDAGIRVQ